MPTSPKKTSWSPSLSPQAHAVLEYLQSGRGLSNLIAISTLGVGSLSSRISELTKRGYEFAKGSHKTPSGKRYTVYKLVMPPKGV